LIIVCIPGVIKRVEGFGDNEIDEDDEKELIEKGGI